MDTFQREGGAMQMIDPIRKESSGAIEQILTGQWNKKKLDFSNLDRNQQLWLWFSQYVVQWQTYWILGRCIDWRTLLRTILRQNPYPCKSIFSISHINTFFSKKIIILILTYYSRLYQAISYQECEQNTSWGNLRKQSLGGFLREFILHQLKILKLWRVWRQLSFLITLELSYL